METSGCQGAGGGVGMSFGRAGLGKQAVPANSPALPSGPLPRESLPVTLPLQCVHLLSRVPTGHSESLGGGEAPDAQLTEWSHCPPSAPGAGGSAALLCSPQESSGEVGRRIA